MDDVELVCKVTPGETINILTREIVIHNSYYATISRWWNCDNRVMLVEWLKAAIRSELSKMMNAQQKVRLRRLTYGLRNLASTYVGTQTSVEILMLVEDVEIKLYTFTIPIIDFAGVNMFV